MKFLLKVFLLAVIFTSGGVYFKYNKDTKNPDTYTKTELFVNLIIIRIFGNSTDNDLVKTKDFYFKDRNIVQSINITLDKSQIPTNIDEMFEKNFEKIICNKLSSVKKTHSDRKYIALHSNFNFYIVVYDNKNNHVATAYIKNIKDNSPNCSQWSI